MVLHMGHGESLSFLVANRRIRTTSVLVCFISPRGAFLLPPSFSASLDSTPLLSMRETPAGLRTRPCHEYSFPVYYFLFFSLPTLIFIATAFRLFLVSNTLSTSGSSFESIMDFTSVGSLCVGFVPKTS